MTPLSHCVNIDSTTRKRRSVANPSPCPGHCPVGTTGHDKPHHGMHQVNECKNDTSGHGGAMSGCPVLAPPTTAMASWSLTSGSANAALHSIMGAPVAARSSLIMSVVTFTLMGRASRLHTGVAPAGVADRAPWHKPKDMERIMLWEWRGEQRCEIENCGCIALPCTLREGRVVGMQEGTGRAEDPYYPVLGGCCAAGCPPAPCCAYFFSHPSPSSPSSAISPKRARAWHQGATRGQ